MRSTLSTSILVDRQRFLLRGNRVVQASPISSGRYGHLTETGSFKIIQKEMDHYSSLYGKIVDAWGRTVVSDADSDMKVPRGGKFIPAPMHYFMRFHEGTGMHAGYLPGYPASHGCVRMPEQYAIRFFQRSRYWDTLCVFSAPRRERVSISDTGLNHLAGYRMIAVMIQDTIPLPGSAVRSEICATARLALIRLTF
jgi:hypothetical protein